MPVDGSDGRIIVVRENRGRFRAGEFGAEFEEDKEPPFDPLREIESNVKYNVSRYLKNSKYYMKYTRI
jgi:hypothetical protein